MAIMLEIESVFRIHSRGIFVIVRQIDPKQSFSITEKSFLGGVELAKYLDIPRYTDSNGNQRPDIVALQLKNEDDRDKVTPGALVELIPGDKIHFLDPWEELEGDKGFYEKELFCEMAKGHVLFGKQVTAIAKRCDNDEVLFELKDGEDKFAIVHLTWRKKEEVNSQFPITKLFKNWLELYNNCIVPDHVEYNL